MGFFSKILSKQPETKQAQVTDASQHLLLQQQANVDYITILVKTGRADQASLDDAIRRLNEIKSLEPIRVEPELVSNPIVSEKPEEAMILRKQLMNDIDALMRQRAEVCNAMHNVPPEQDCPELIAKALSLHEEVEAAWTKYRYLERNGKLPDIEPEKVKQNSLELLQKMAERKSLSEKRTKLKKKINDPTNIRHKKLDEWKEEFDYCLRELQELDDEIYLLKNR